MTEPEPEGDPTAEPEASRAAPDTESDFEASVKGIGQGIAGRFKELLGELIDDPSLEEEGIVQRLDGQIRRSQAEQRQPPEEEPAIED